MPKWPYHNSTFLTPEKLQERNKADSSFNYFTLCGIESNNIIEIGMDGLLDIEQQYGVEGYQDKLGKYDKVIVSEQTEGYGMATKLVNFYHNFDKEKIFIINDGFVCEKYVEEIYWGVPRENIFYDPALSIWTSWNCILSDVGRTQFRPSTKINDGFRFMHKNNIDNMFPECNKDREFKFMLLNNNFKEGRAQCINTLSDSFIKNNWVSANFFVDELNWLEHKYDHLISPTDDPSGGGPVFEKNLIPPEDREVYKYLRKDDFSKYENDQSGWNSCYEILWKEHLNKAYIQPYWESCAWTDAMTDGHYMLNEKTLLPIVMGHITIPLGIFYVDYLEKMGYQFVKKIGDISINETVPQEDILGFSRSNWPLTHKVQEWNYELFDKLNKIDELYSLKDIRDEYVENLDIIEHNRSLMKHHMSDESILEKLKNWIEQ
jgi:hypothetical protein